MATQINYYGVPPSQQMLIENRYLYTATAGQTTFNAQYGANYSLDVYYNGSRIEDYTATDNAHVVLNTPAVAGALVRIVARPLVPSNVAYVPYSGAIMTGPMTLFGGDTAHTPAAGDSSQLIANTQFVQTTNSAVQGEIKNFKATVPGLNSYTTTFTADEVVLKNSSNFYITIRNVNLTANANGTVGAPLSIMQARAASTWLYRWLWYNSTNGLTVTFDTNLTTPSAPTGYSSSDYNCRLPGASRTDSSGSTYLKQIQSVGKDSWYVPLSGSNTTSMPGIATGAIGTFDLISPTWSAIGVLPVLPQSAVNAGGIHAYIGAVSTSANSGIVAPNNNYGGPQSSNPPLLTTANMGNTISMPQFGSFLLESSNIYVAQAVNVQTLCYGWFEV